MLIFLTKEILPLLNLYIHKIWCSVNICWVKLSCIYNYNTIQSWLLITSTEQNSPSIRLKFNCVPSKYGRPRGAITWNPLSRHWFPLDVTQMESRSLEVRDKLGDDHLCVHRWGVALTGTATGTYNTHGVSTCYRRVSCDAQHSPGMQTVASLFYTWEHWSSGMLNKSSNVT